MNELLKNSKKIEIKGSTVDFFEFEKDNITYYYFDTSLCTPPDPMINAMIGLQLLDNENKRLIMINHKAPLALFPRIENAFEYTISKFEEEKVKVTFQKNVEQKETVDFNNNKCEG